MRFKTGLWLLTVVSLFGLAGCGGNGTSANANTQTSTPYLVSIAVTPSGSSITAGAEQQFTATGNYSDGSSRNLTTSAVWSTSASTIASIASGGMATGVAAGQANVIATSSSISGSTTLNVMAKPVVLVSLSLSPAGPAVVIGGAQQFQVIGSYSDGSTQNLTASANWSSSNAVSATINSAGVATGAAAGPATITAAAGGMTATTALNVVNSVYANFSGNYAFTLGAADTRGPTYFAGTVTADGNGNITGVEDSNTGSGVLQNVSVTGKYVIYPDGRGSITFNPNSCHPSGISLRVILTAGGNTGSIIESDGLGVAKGALVMQNTAAFTQSAISGAYVFRASGIGAGNSATTSEPVGELGLFTANGAGVISSGLEDVNDYGTIQQYVPLVQSAYTVGTNGRGTLTLTTAAGSADFVIYVVDATRLNFLAIDPSPADAIAGLALLQDSMTFSAATMGGSYPFVIGEPITAPTGGSIPNVEFADFGEYTFDDVSAVTGTRSNVGISGGFEVTGTYVLGQYANGRGSFTTQDCATPTSCNDERTYVFYMISPGKMFLLQDYSASDNPLVGEADLQASQAFSEASLTGSYVLHAFDPIANDTLSLLWLTMDGTGNIAGIADSVQGTSFVSEVISNPYYIYDLNSSGTGTIELTTSAGTQDYRLYVVSPQKAWVHGVDPALDGSLDQQ
jgi:hypothetical protein